MLDSHVCAVHMCWCLKQSCSAFVLANNKWFQPQSLFLLVPFLLLCVSKSQVGIVISLVKLSQIGASSSCASDSLSHGESSSFSSSLPPWQIPLQRALLKYGGVDVLCQMLSSSSVAIRRRAAALVKELVSSPLHRPGMGGWRTTSCGSQVLTKLHTALCKRLQCMRKQVHHEDHDDMWTWSCSHGIVHGLVEGWHTWTQLSNESWQWLLSLASCSVEIIVWNHVCLIWWFAVRNISCAIRSNLQVVQIQID